MNESFEKRRELLKKKEIINNFFQTMAIKNICLIISLVITKKDLGVYAILIIIIDYAITIFKFKEIYKRIVNGIIILLLLVNLVIELMIGFNNLYIIFLLIILYISIKYISHLKVKLFEKAKKAWKNRHIEIYIYMPILFLLKLYKKVLSNFNIVTEIEKYDIIILIY